MAEPSRLSIIEHFAPIENPQIECSKRHRLIDIIVIAILNVAFGEDDCRVRQGYAAQNFAVLHDSGLGTMRERKGSGRGPF